MQEKKDVLFLCQFFYPEYISSATLPYDTAVKLVEAGFSVDVLCGYPKEYNDDKEVPLEEESNGINIKRLKYVQMKRSNTIGRLINYFSFTLVMIARFIRMRKYKSIIVYSNPPILPVVAAMASKLFGTKVIFVSYDVYPEIAIKTNTVGATSIVANFMRVINKFLYKNISKVVALSDDMKDFLLQNRESLTEKQVVVIPNWFEDKPIDNTHNPYSNTTLEPVKASEKLVVSYFGNMGVAQDLTTLLKAAKALRSREDIVFLLAGHGKKVQEIKNEVEKESLTNVKMYDFLHGNDFQDALNISDVFIVTLEQGLEGLAVPSKTYSYMMAGKPIIAVMSKNTEVARELLMNKAGYAVEVGDVKELASAIEDLNNDVVTRVQTGINSRKLFKDKYTKEICTTKYVDLMDMVLESEE